MQPPQTERKKKRKDAKHRTPRESGGGADGSRKEQAYDPRYQLLALAREDAPFIPSEEFRGAVPGYYFGTTEKLGTGYYRDENALEVVETEEPTDPTAEIVAPAPASATTEVALTVPAPDAALAAATPTGAALAALAALAVDAALAGDAAAAAASADEARAFLRARKDDRVVTALASGRTESAANQLARSGFRGDVMKIVRELNKDENGKKLGLKRRKGSTRNMKAGAEQEGWLLEKIGEGKITAAAMAAVLGTNYRGANNRGGIRPVLAARHWSDPEGNASFPPVPGPLKPKKRLWFASTAQLGRFPGLAVSHQLAGAYLRAPPGENYDDVNLVALEAFAISYAVDGDELRDDVQVVPLDWTTQTQTSAYERVLRESAGRVADERARAAETARLERELARKRRLAAAKNRVTVVGHAATLGADADLAQKEAAVANAIALLPDDVLNFSL